MRGENARGERVKGEIAGLTCFTYDEERDPKKPRPMH